MQTVLMQLAGAVTQAEGLSDIIARTDADRERSNAELALLADTWKAREANIAPPLETARQGLTAAEAEIVDGQHHDMPTARALAATANGVQHLAGLAQQIKDGVQAIAGANRTSDIRQVGNQLLTLVAALDTAADSVIRVFSGQPDTPQTPPFANSQPKIESTAATPDSINRGIAASLPDATASVSGHLLVMTTESGASFYFNLKTAGYDSLKRQTAYNIAEQDRLTRRPALQAVSKGGEKLRISGAIFTKASGAGQMNRLREIGHEMKPVLLTTGYGENFGRWYLTEIEEEQSFVFGDGMPRKQEFTLEFKRYGEDYQNI